MVKKVNVEIELYKYEELGEEAKYFALNEHKDFLDSSNIMFK
jgi:hypothetical protein